MNPFAIFVACCCRLLEGVAPPMTQRRRQEDSGGVSLKLRSCQFCRGVVGTDSHLTMPVESLPVRDASIHFRLLQQYLVLLKKYPILTKSVTRSVALSLLSVRLYVLQPGARSLPIDSHNQTFSFTKVSLLHCNQYQPL